MASIISATIINAFTITSTIGIGLVQVGVGLVGSAIARALTGKNKARQTPGLLTKFTGQGDTTPQTIILGRYATAGHMIAPYYTHTKNPLATTGPTIGTNNTIGSGDYATFIINLSDAPVSGLNAVYVDGIRFQLDTHLTGAVHTSYGKSVTTGVDRDEWDGKLWLKFYDGTQTAVDPYLLNMYGAHPTRPWLSTNIHKGGAYAIVTLKRDDTLFRGIPRFLFEVDGLEVTDPRTATTAHTTNAIVLAHAVAEGVTMPDGQIFAVNGVELPSAYWEAAMDVCDEQVAKEGGGTESQYRAGLEVSIATPDNGGSDPLSALDDLLPAASADVADLGGELIVRAGGPGISVLAISDNDILNSRDQSYEPFNSLQNSHNAVAATFPNPDAKWEATEAPLRVDAQAETGDGERLIASLALNSVPYSEQVQRLMGAWLKDALRRRLHVIYLPYNLDRVTVLDTISLTSEIHGYSDKLFEVLEYEPDLRTGAFLVVIREIDPADFTPDVADIQPQVIPTVVRTAPPVLVIDTFTALPIIIDDGSGTEIGGIRITWELPSDNLEGVSWRIKLGASTVVLGSNSDTEEREVIVSENLIHGATYNVEVRPIATGQKTGWSTPISVQVPDVKLKLRDIAQEVVDEVVAIANEVGIPSVSTLPASGSVPNQVVLKIPEGVLYRWDDANSEWVTAVSTGVADGSITIAKLAAGIAPVEILAMLPTTGNYAGRTVFLTTDNKLYRHTGSPAGSAGFSASVSATDIAGQLLNAQIASLDANKIAGQITGTQITDNAVTSAKIAANSVTAAKVAAGSIAADKLAANSVTSDKLAANSVIAGKVASDAITAGTIAAAAINTRELAAGAVTATKVLISGEYNLILDPEFYDLDNYWTALAGVTFAVNDQQSSLIYKQNRVLVIRNILPGPAGWTEIVRGQLFTVSENKRYFASAGFWSGDGNSSVIVRVAFYNTSGAYLGKIDIFQGALTTTGAVFHSGEAVAPAGAVNARFEFFTDLATSQTNYNLGKVQVREMNAGELIVDGQITADKLSADSVTTNKLAASAVVASKIAAGAITTPKILAGSITAETIATDAITTDKLTTGSITVEKFASGSIKAPLNFIDVEVIKNSNAAFQFKYSGMVMMYMFGAGGGGGAARSQNSNAVAGAGGGAGGAATLFVRGVNTSDTYNVVIAVGGVGGTADNTEEAVGLTPSQTRFLNHGVELRCNGGAGGGARVGPSLTAIGGVGGTATGGDYNYQGGTAGNATSTSGGTRTYGGGLNLGLTDNIINTPSRSLAGLGTDNRQFMNADLLLMRDGMPPFVGFEGAPFLDYCKGGDGNAFSSGEAGTVSAMSGQDGIVFVFYLGERGLV